jgi:hypothetical protein
VTCVLSSSFFLFFTFVAVDGVMMEVGREAAKIFLSRN